jgi:heme exporter protein D
VTDSSVAENQRAVAGYSAQLVGLYIWLGLVITVVPTIAITLSVRRRRAAR